MQIQALKKGLIGMSMLFMGEKTYMIVMAELYLFVALLPRSFRAERCMYQILPPKGWIN
jgi:hypothetical protein